MYRKVDAVNDGLLKRCLACVGVAVFLFGSASLPIPSSAAAIDYHLDAGDIVEFDFLDDIDPPRQLTIASDGTIQVPLLGPVQVGGLFASDALAFLRKSFLDRHLLVDPKISFSVLTFRPIYVLGEVKSPGAFPFQPLLTVEQGVGLAGGPLTTTTVTEDRVVTRTRIKGELDGVSAELTREAISAAQAAAKLKNAVVISDSDIPEQARSMMTESLARQLRTVGESILLIEQQAFETQTTLLSDAIAEAERQIGILEQLVVNQKQNVQATKEQLERISALFKKGLTVADEVSELHRQLTTDESRLLATYSEVSNTRQQISTMKRDLTQLEEVRKKEALTSLKEHQVEIAKFIATRQSLEEQLYLVSNLMADAAQQKTEFVVAYEIRRRTKTGLEQLSATNVTLLMPGDVVLVSLDKLTSPAALQQ
jgi:exopolysaccharide production protein ExoF